MDTANFSAEYPYPPYKKSNFTSRLFFVPIANVFGGGGWGLGEEAAFLQKGCLLPNISSAVPDGGAG